MMERIFEKVTLLLTMKVAIGVLAFLTSCQVDAFQVKLTGIAKGKNVCLNKFHGNFLSPTTCPTVASLMFRNMKGNVDLDSSNLVRFFKHLSSHLNCKWKFVKGKVLGRRFACRHRLLQCIRKILTAAVLFFLVSMACLDPAWAVSSGRAGGGSFKRSSSETTRPVPLSRSSSWYRPNSYYRPPPRIIMRHCRPLAPVYSFPLGESPVVVSPYYGPTRRVSVSDVVLITGTGALVTLGVIEHYRRNGGVSKDSALGPGVSVVSLTMALSEPYRGRSNSVLSRISRLAQSARTDTRKGVQDLISDVALELLRHERSIVSVGSDYEHFHDASAGERKFNTLSIQQRSKFDEEIVKNFGGEKTIYDSPVTNETPRPTFAVVTINLCIEGDSTRISDIRNRKDLRNALSRIASDSQVDECLICAEVLWAPEDPSESLSSEDIYADFPSLYPFID